jgi:hypothetical protein
MMALAWMAVGAAATLVIGGLIAVDLWRDRERGYLEMLAAKDERIEGQRWQIADLSAWISPPAPDGAGECRKPTDPLRGRGIVTSACPTCGGPEVDDAFTDTAGEGFRVCASCGEEWWTDIAYPPHKPTRYLTAEECRQRGDAARVAMDAKGGGA